MTSKFLSHCTAMEEAHSRAEKEREKFHIWYDGRYFIVRHYQGMPPARSRHIETVYPK